MWWWIIPLMLTSVLWFVICYCISVIFDQLFENDWWKKVAYIVSAIPIIVSIISILCNILFAVLEFIWSFNWTAFFFTT